MKLSSLILSIFLFSSIVSADIYVSPFYVNFGSVKVNEMGFRQTIYVTNRGPATFVSVNSSCYGDFYATNSCYGTLNPYYSCGISVEFRPNSEGYKTCSIYIREDSGLGEAVQVSGRAYN